MLFRLASVWSDWQSSKITSDWQAVICSQLRPRPWIYLCLFRCASASSCRLLSGEQLSSNLSVFQLCQHLFEIFLKSKKVLNYHNKFILEVRREVPENCKLQSCFESILFLLKINKNYRSCWFNFLFPPLTIICPLAFFFSNEFQNFNFWSFFQVLVGEVPHTPKTSVSR